MPKKKAVSIKPSAGGKKPTRQLSNMLKEIKIADIKIGKRHRRDMGDLTSLADSIRRLGLLQPPLPRHNALLVGITSDELRHASPVVNPPAHPSTTNSLGLLKYLTNLSTSSNDCWCGCHFFSFVSAKNTSPHLSCFFHAPFE